MPEQKNNCEFVFCFVIFRFLSGYIHLMKAVESIKMNSLLKQRLLVSVTGRHLMREPKNFNFICLKNGRASYSNSDSLCPPPSKDPPPPCPPPRDPPPCPPPPPPCGPPCPPPPYAAVPNPNNPCNYVRPEDPDAHDFSKLKQAQCLFQQDTETPSFLKGGKGEVYFFQGTLILGAISFILSLRTIYGLIQMFA